MRADASGQSQSPPQALHDTSHWRDIFEDRHGAGAYERLHALLARPCVPYARIATHFNVTRECVRQWHRMLMPDAPRGHARQRICAQLRQRQRLLADPLFRAFFVHVRRAGRDHRIELLPASTGYRRRLARLNGRLVSLQEARRMNGDGDASKAFMLSAYTGPAEYLFVRLDDEEFLFLPSRTLAAGSVFLNAAESPLMPFKNTLNGLAPDPVPSVERNDQSD